MGDWTRFELEHVARRRLLVQLWSDAYGEEDEGAGVPDNDTLYANLVARMREHADAAEANPEPDPSPSQVAAIEREVLRKVARALLAMRDERARSAERLVVGSIGQTLVRGQSMGFDTVANALRNDPNVASDVVSALRAEGLPVGGEDA